jgi:hypothetical protein
VCARVTGLSKFPREIRTAVQGSTLLSFCVEAACSALTTLLRLLRLLIAQSKEARKQKKRKPEPSCSCRDSTRPTRTGPPPSRRPRRGARSGSCPGSGTSTASTRTFCASRGAEARTGASLLVSVLSFACLLAFLLSVYGSSLTAHLTTCISPPPPTPLQAAWLGGHFGPGHPRVR